MITDSVLQALRVQFEAKFQAAYRDTPAIMGGLYMDVTSTAESTVYGFLEDMIEIREWFGERETQQLKESSYRLTNRRFEASAKLNRDRIADDTLDTFANVSVPMLGRAAKSFADKQLAQILLDNATCFDGLPFFDPSHPVIAPGIGASTTYSNSLALALDATNLAAAYAALRSFTNSAGNVRDVGPTFELIVSPTLEFTARTLVQAPFGAGGATNIQAGMASVRVVPQLASNANRWFLAATGLPVKPLIRQVREAVRFDVLDASPAECVVKRNENEYGVTFREAYGVSFPWLMIASDPDGAMT